MIPLFRTAILSLFCVIPLAAMADPPPYGGYGYGPGMMMGPQLTPEQWQQRWEYMHQQGYGPGMMGGGPWSNMTPQQQQQWWDMHRQGYGPGMMGPGMMGPGMMGPGMMGPGMMRLMTPDEYKKWWEQTQAQPGPTAPPGKPAK